MGIGGSNVAILIRHGRVIDPASGVDRVADVLIDSGRISQVGDGVTAGPATQVVEATGLIVTPGWIDAHTHLRDPGFTYKEDLNTAARAALAGGFVRVCCMPNTNPPLDTAEGILDIIERGSETGIHIHPIGTITVGRRLQEIAPLEEMARAGAVGFSDDGESTESIEAMRSALRLSSELNLPIMVHCEDPDLLEGGSIHRGSVSEELGDPGVPAEAEEAYIARDITLAEETGGWLHVLHVSTVRGARMVADAKARGVRVTAEVMPHHMTLTDEWVAGRRRFAGEDEIIDIGRVDTNAKVNPPLRPESDALGLAAFVCDGTFDFIATDHAPHAPRDKNVPLSQAAFGMSGLELAIPSMVKVIERGELSWPVVVASFTDRPARTLNLPGGTLGVGANADVTIIDPEREWNVEKATLQSKSKNTPLLGMTVRGRAVMTIVEGKILHDELSQR